MTTSASQATRLPAEYASLEPFVDKWALDDSSQRGSVRVNSSIEELREFYSAMLPVAAGAAESLRGTAVEDLDERRTTLLKLLLSLAEVAVGVECFGAPIVPDAIDQSRVVPVYVLNMTPLF